MGRAPNVNIKVNSNVNINKIIDDAINNTTVNKQNSQTIISNNNIKNATNNLFNSEVEEVDLYADSQINTNSHAHFAQEQSNVNTLGENSNLQDITSSHNDSFVSSPSEEINQSRILNSNSQNLNQGSNNYVNNVLIGRRGSVTSWTQYAPSKVNGHEFVRWEVTDAYEQGMNIKVYKAIYK